MLETHKEQLQTTGEITIRVKVHPSARENRVKSILADGVIKIDLHATPEQGKGNDALFDFLSQEFNVPSSNIQILLGKFSADKTIKIVK